MGCQQQTLGDCKAMAKFTPNITMSHDLNLFFEKPGPVIDVLSVDDEREGVLYRLYKIIGGADMLICKRYYVAVYNKNATQKISLNMEYCVSGFVQEYKCT